MKKLTFGCISFLLIFCMVFSGCASRRNLTTEAFQSACEAAGFTVTDSIDQFDASTTLTALTVNEETATVGYFVFASSALAKTNYAQMLSSVKTGAKGEKYVDSSEYNRFTGTNGDAQTLLYRNGATLFYIISTDSAAYDTMLKTLGI